MSGLCCSIGEGWSTAEISVLRCWSQISKLLQVSAAETGEGMA
jgi:hypothetical protein